MPSLKKQTVDGVKWLVGVSFLQKIISFATTIIIARRLGPSVYGLFAFALVVVTSFELFKSLGIDAALIRRQEDFKEAADTAFFIIPLIGIMLYILLFLSAPILGRFLGNTDLVPVVKILGIIFVIGCFTKVPAIYLEKNMLFRQCAIAEFISVTVFSLSAIIFTFLDFKVWALVYSYIIKVFTYMILIWSFADWRPSFNFNKKIAGEMLHFGKFILLTAILWFLKSNLDNIFVGKLLGTAMLGLYAVAFNIANFGPEYFGTKVTRVIYPAYSQLHKDAEALSSAFLKVLRFIAIVALPLAVGTILLGREFLVISYGNKWLEATPVLRILALVAIFNLIPVATGNIFLAMGKPKIGFWSTFIQVATFFILLAPFVKYYGLVGAGIIIVLGAVLAMGFEFWFVTRMLSLKLVEIVNSLKPAFLSALVMGCIILLTKMIIPSDMLPKLRFIPEFIVAGGSYALALLVIHKESFDELKIMIGIR